MEAYLKWRAENPDPPQDENDPGAELPEDDDDDNEGDDYDDEEGDDDK